MLSLSLQPLLDNVERVGLGPALRILRAVARMTRQTVEGQAIELDWVRANAWQLDDADYLADGGAQDQLVLVHHAAAGRGDRGRRAARAAGTAGAARPTPRRRLPDHRRPAEPARRPRGLRQGDRRRPLGGQADPDAAARTAACAEPDDRDRALQILAKRRPSRRYRASARRGAGRAGRRGTSLAPTGAGGDPDGAARPRHGYREEPRRHPLALRLLRAVGSLDHARAVAGRAGRRGGGGAGRPRLAARQPAPATCSAGSSTTSTSAPDERPERRGAARPAGRAGPDPGRRPRPRSSAAPRGCFPSRLPSPQDERGRVYELLARRPPSGARQPGRRYADCTICSSPRAAATPRPPPARSCATRWSASEAVDAPAPHLGDGEPERARRPAPPSGGPGRVGRAAGRRDHRAGASTTPSWLASGRRGSRDAHRSRGTLSPSRAASSTRWWDWPGWPGWCARSRTRTATGRRWPAQPDEFVHLLLAVASLGDAVDRLARAAPARAADADAAQPTPAASTRGRGYDEHAGRRPGAQRLPPRPGARHRPAGWLQGVAPLRGPAGRAGGFSSTSA